MEHEEMSVYTFQMLSLQFFICLIANMLLHIGTCCKPDHNTDITVRNCLCISLNTTPKPALNESSIS